MAYRLVTNLEIYTVNCGLLFPGKIFSTTDISAHFLSKRDEILQCWTQHPKRHLDRFSRFAGLTTVTDRQTTLLGLSQ